jgi:hypothetical protein
VAVPALVLPLLGSLARGRTAARRLLPTRTLSRGAARGCDPIGRCAAAAAVLCLRQTRLLLLLYHH